MRARALRRFLPSVLAVVAGVLAFVRAGSTSALRVTVDADTLYGLLLQRDLHAWGGRLSEWNLPPSPSWFPDLTLLWCARSLGIGGPRAMQLAGEALLALTFAGWLVLARRRVGLLLAFTFALVLVGPLSALLGSGVQLESHGALAAATPWMLVLGLSRRKTAHVVLACMVGLLVASDSLVVPALVLPFVLVARARHRRAAVVVTAASFGGWLFGHVLRERALLASYLDVDPGDSWRSLVMFCRWCTHLALHDPASALVVPFSLALLARSARRPGPHRLVARFVLASLVVTLGSLLLFGQFLDRGGARYVLPLLLGASCAAASRISSLLFTKLTVRPAWVSMAALALGASSFVLDTEPLPTVARADLLEPLERELAARGLHAGAASYWDAKVLTYLSERGTFVTALAPDRALPYAWNANAHWALWHPPEFLLVPADDPTLERDAKRLLGPPAERIPIGDRLLLTYAAPDAIATAFAPYLVDLEVVGNTAAFPGSDRAREVSFGYRGPWVMLPPGRYGIELEPNAGPPSSGSFRVRAGRRAHLEGSWPVPSPLLLEVPRAAPLLVDLVVSSADRPALRSLRVTRIE